MEKVVVINNKIINIIIIITMMMIVLQTNDQSTIKAPPLLQPLTQEILKKSFNSLLDQILAHFKNYLSPFIRKEHLCLETSFEEIRLDYPIFTYFHFLDENGPNEFISTIFCSVRSINEQAVLKRKYLLKNSIVIIQEKNKHHEERIKRKSQIESLNKIIGEQTILMQGKQIKLIPSKMMGEKVEYSISWSELLLQKWNKFESQNQCIYMLIK